MDVRVAQDAPTFSFKEGIRVREMYNSPADPLLSIATTWVAVGTTTALHALDVDECQRIIRGQGLVQLGDGPPVLVNEGDVVVIAKGTPQRITNVGGCELELDCVCTPRFTEGIYHHFADPIVRPAASAAKANASDLVAVIPSFGEASSRAHRGEVAVVTGGYGGIGLEACRQLGRQGFAVVLTGRDGKKGTRAAEALTKEGIDARFVEVDVTRHDQIAELSARVARELGRCDVLVNCAGVLLDGPGQKTDGDAFARTFAINVAGPASMTEAFLPLMERQGAGRVINVTSELGTSAWRGESFAVYAASKAALNRYTRSLAEQNAPKGISVNAVDPGWVRTAMGGEGAPDGVLDGVQALLWLATAPDPPSGALVRRSKGAPLPDGYVAIEREAW
jgi:NAD(P)-dependent dehydrogenase (short-subunit alcohol dehydrogenase family)/mannose-6-phosphate isomerase-like protein (cupin superfamily)